MPIYLIFDGGKKDDTINGAHAMGLAYNIGFDNGHLAGEYANPFDKETETGEWLSYKEGFKAGTECFFAEESTPLSEQIALSDG